MAQRTSIGFDHHLTGFAHGLRNEDAAYIADTVAPPVDVGARTGSHYLFSHGFGFAAPTHGIVRVSGGRFNRLVPEITQVSVYTLRESGVEAVVDDSDERLLNEDEVSLRQDATSLAWHTLMTERERDLVTLLNAGITQTSALVGAARWDDANSDPRDQANLAGRTIRRATGIPQRKLSLVIGDEGWESLRKSAALLQYFRAQTPGMTQQTPAQAAEALGIKEVIIGSAVANGAAENLATNNADVWARDVAYFVHIQQRPVNGQVPGTAYTFQERGRPQGGIERYREEPRSEIVLASTMDDRALVRANAGYRFTTIVT